jgi:hypothetical protein
MDSAEGGAGCGGRGGAGVAECEEWGAVVEEGALSAGSDGARVCFFFF